MGFYKRCSESVAHYYGWRDWNQVLDHSFRDQSGKKVFKKVKKFVKKAAGFVLPLAGTAIGGFFGGPAGASIGGKIGGAVGGFFGGREIAKEQQAGPGGAFKTLMQPFGGRAGMITGQAEDILTRAGLSRNAGAILATLGGLHMQDVGQQREFASQFIGQPGPTEAGMRGAGTGLELGKALGGILPAIFGGGGGNKKQTVAGLSGFGGGHPGL